METANQTITLLQFFEMGGWAMWPLLIFSIATISIIIERFINIFLLTRLSVKDVHKNVLGFLNNKDIISAKKTCMDCDRKNIGAHVLLSGLNMAGLSEHRMEKAIESEATEKINQLERGFSLLVALGSIAPITGFLGTVSGMISAFRSIANAADVNAQLVAGGIFEALITTAYGLAIAILAITGYNIFSYFVDKFTADIEQAGSDMVTAVLLMNRRTGK
ncbi:MAG: MotA/TolQ/ExbB proton channel family protein [Spirochaetes bacterium]|nr:MotA/TolQ/ExbB proton channel family protein [Spirochaetota bacterium]